MLSHKQKIGRLDREIYFIQPVISNGVSNEDKIDAWELIPADCFMSARKMDKDGNTTVTDNRITFIQTTDWIIRHRTDLNNRMRIVYNTQVYEILSITDAYESRDRYLKIVSNLLDNVLFT
jgi:SPP1 family predicted phage head-tail adaptor